MLYVELVSGTERDCGWIEHAISFDQEKYIENQLIKIIMSYERYVSSGM